MVRFVKIEFVDLRPRRVSVGATTRPEAWYVSRPSDVVRDSRAQLRYFVGMTQTGAEVLKYTE